MTRELSGRRSGTERHASHLWLESSESSPPEAFQGARAERGARPTSAQCGVLPPRRGRPDVGTAAKRTTWPRAVESYVMSHAAGRWPTSAKCGVLPQPSRLSRQPRTSEARDMYMLILRELGAIIAGLRPHTIKVVRGYESASKKQRGRTSGRDRVRQLEYFENK